MYDNKQTRSMNKFIFYLIFSLLLTQCFSDGDAQTGENEITGCEEGTEENCSEKSPSNLLYKCIFIENAENGDANGCKPVLKTCEEAASLTGADCSKLSPQDGQGICLTGSEGCSVVETCGEVSSGATEEICNKFLTNEPTNKCALIETGTEPNVEAHCEVTLRGCTEEVEGITLNQNICSSRTTDEKFCYLDGSSCKEASSCNEIILSSGETTELCGHFDSTEGKCIPSQTTCTFKAFCNKASKTSELECDDFILENEGNVCVPKLGSNSECEEISNEEASIRDLCSQKTQEECKILIQSNLLVECEWNEGSNGSNGVCKFKAKYSTCSSANDLGEATAEQCSILEHRVFEECIKDNEGCKINTKACTDTTIEYTEGICDNLKPSTGAKCYYDGVKCAEANSCESVGETSLNDNEKLASLCRLFNDETNNCVPQENKCTLQEKVGPETGNDGKEKENESGKDEEKDKENEKDKEKESGKDEEKDKENEKDNEKESGKDEGKDKEKEKESGKDEGKDKETDSKNTDGTGNGTTDAKEKEKENNEESGKEKDKGSNSGRLLSFSFLTLFFILAL